MTYQIKTLRTGTNSILQTLLGITMGSPTRTKASRGPFFPPLSLILPLCSIFHSLSPPLPCLPKGGSHACSPLAPARQTQKINYTPTPLDRGKRHASLFHFQVRPELNMFLLFLFQYLVDIYYVPRTVLRVKVQG